MTTNFSEENSTIRLALGRDFQIGSFYTTVTDTFDNSQILLFTNDRLKSDKLGYKPIYKMIYGKTLGDKVKILEAHPEHEFNIMSCQVSCQNYFVKFLNEKNYNFGDQRIKRAVFKFEWKINKTGIDINKEYKFLNKELKKNNLTQNLLVVTEITYGLQIIGVLWFINENNLSDNYLEKTFKLILEGLCHQNDLNFLNFSNLDDNVKTNLKIDFIDNIRKIPYNWLTFDNFIDNFKRLLTSTTKDYKPIEYKLMSIKNHIPITHAELNIVLKFYSKLNEHLSSLLDKWHEFDTYSNYYESFKRNSVKNDLYNFLEIVTSVLRKEVKEIKKNPEKYEAGSIKKKIDSFSQEIKKIEESLKNLEPNPIQLRDIKFFKKNSNIIYLESRWNGKKIELDDGFILGYSLGLKEQNRDQWKTCLGEFMSLMHDNQDNRSFYVLNFDICKPQNFTSFDKIQLMKIENDKMSLYDCHVNVIKEVCENKELKSTIEEENKKEDINIVLLGETGVGKSTFVNAFANYINFESLEEASKNNQKYLIESCFYYTNEDYKTERIQIGESKNEVFIQGQSSTQCAQEYTFPLSHKNNRILRIIDTPGMGDSRGHQVDKENFDKTIDFLSKFKHINAICFLVKPNNPRLLPGFRYCFKELLSHLHKDTTNNLVFCFTNARSTQYRPGETLGALKKFLNDVQMESNVSIPFEKKNMFCVDNEAFRYLMLKNRGVNFDDIEQHNFSNSWEISSNNSIEMMKYIMNNLKPLETKSILLFNNLRKVNIEVAMKAADLLKTMILKKYELLKEKNQLDWLSIYPKLSNEMANKNEIIAQLIYEVLNICAKLSNIIRSNSLSVYNDDIEAYLSEFLRDRDQILIRTNAKDDEKISKLFKDAIQDYNQFKKQVEVDLRSKKLTFKEGDFYSYANQLFKIEKEFKNVDSYSTLF